MNHLNLRHPDEREHHGHVYHVGHVDQLLEPQLELLPPLLLEPRVGVVVQQLAVLWGQVRQASCEVVARQRSPHLQ